MTRCLRTRTIVIVWIVIGMFSTAIGQDSIRIDVQVDQPKHPLPEVLYGVFYEDINYSGDGGLHAELVQNRSFEYHPVRGRSEQDPSMQPLAAWSKVELDGGECALSVENKTPLNQSNTNYVRLSRKTPLGTVGLRNSGFDGIRVVAGEKYDFSFYARKAGEAATPVTVSIQDSQGKTLALTVFDDLSTQWKKYEAELTVSGSDERASLVLTTTCGSDILMDMISLFPRDTFMGRKNGMRKDLAQAIADLRPKTFRFPGGCLVHGWSLSNAYRWKDTVGDIAQRKPNWNLWGYHQTYGIGYFEYFQFCEDIGAEPLPILPLGISCGFRPPFENEPMEELQSWIDDAIDLIEFANGPADSEWGSVRAKMGHPAPFGLKYLGLGNEEHHTKEFEQRFPHFVKAIRAKHPEIQIVGTSGLGDGIPIYKFMAEQKVELSDEHYYNSPEWFIANRNRFDNFDRSGPKIFVGEYASRGNTLYNAVAEAVYLTGIERNADFVEMTAYAPLLARYGFTQWQAANLIWFDQEKVVLTPNYHVQQLFSLNKGDEYLQNTVSVNLSEKADGPALGQIGLATWETGAIFDDVKVTGPDGTLIEEDFSGQPANWQVIAGDFAIEDGAYKQTDQQLTPAISLHKTKIESDTITYSLRAKKTGGREGFLIVFGGRSKDEFYWWNIGGWGNTKHAIEYGTQGYSAGKRQLGSKPGRIETGVWYDLRIEIAGRRIRCHLGDELVHDVVVEDAQPGVGVSVAKDTKAGEVILKLANPLERAVNAVVHLAGAKEISPTATVTTLAGERSARNTQENPENVTPEMSTIEVAEEFRCELPPMSVRFIRVGVK